MTIYYYGTSIEPRQGDIVRMTNDGTEVMLGDVRNLTGIMGALSFVRRGEPVEITSREEAVYVLMSGGDIESENGVIIKQESIGFLAVSMMTNYECVEWMRGLSISVGDDYTDAGPEARGKSDEIMARHREKAIHSLLDNHWPPDEQWFDVS